MSGSGKRVTDAVPVRQQDPQSEQVVKHLKDAKSAKRIGDSLPLALYAIVILSCVAF